MAGHAEPADGHGHRGRRPADRDLPRTTTRSACRGRRATPSTRPRSRDDRAHRPAPERTLMLGWNRRGADDHQRARQLRRRRLAASPWSPTAPRRQASVDADALGAPEPDRPVPSRPTPPTAACSTRSTSRATTTSIVLCYSDTLDDAARRRAHADHAAPPARHRGARGPRLLDRAARCSTCATARWPR